MRKKLLACLLLALINQVALATPLTTTQIINRVENNFAKIRDASADITLQYNLHLFGCTGVKKQTGPGYFKYPNKIKATLDNETYFAISNHLRRQDSNGKRFIVRLINAPDLAPGFNPKLIPHNFNLSVQTETKTEFILLGRPKPGVLKNVKQVLFHIDKELYLLRQLDLIFYDQKLSGKINIQYQNIKGLWVPVGFYGKSALQVTGGVLVGLDISLSGENFKINTGLPNSLFEAGF